VQQGCRTAGIGCLDCKQPVIDAVLKEQEPMRERAQAYMDDPTLVRNIIEDGCGNARKMAIETKTHVINVQSSDGEVIPVDPDVIKLSNFGSSERLPP